jgi:DNA (cytosine-5)-methyltransferase 1
VGDAIRDLPTPSDKADEMGGMGLDLYAGHPSAYAAAMRTSSSFPYNHVTRTYKQAILNIIREMRPGQTWDAESKRMRADYEIAIAKFASEQGIPSTVARELLEQSGQINPVFYKDYYWSAYTRLAWDAPALTITANANFLGSGRFSHPEALRGITMREAARLQSFDDDFRFITSDNEHLDSARMGVGMDMIGEAVPPGLAQAIAKHLATQLDAHRTGLRQKAQEKVVTA